MDICLVKKLAKRLFCELLEFTSPSNTVHKHSAVATKSLLKFLSIFVQIKMLSRNKESFSYELQKVFLRIFCHKLLRFLNIWGVF